MNVTVKIIPPDGKWQTACEMIQAIAASSPYEDLNFIVEDVFSTGKPNVNALVTNCEIARNAHQPIVQIHGDKWTIGGYRISDKSFLSEQTKKELGDFLTKYMQGEPHSILVPHVEEIENPVMATLREQFERDNAQRKRQYYNELYRAAKRFIFSYEVYDLKLN